MKKIKIIAIFLFFLLITSCTTSYKRASSPAATGYYDSILQQDMYEITFNGSSETSATKAYDFTLLRAAEVCIENGYKTFDIIKSENRSKTEVGSVPYGYYTTTLVYSETYPKFMLIIKCSKENNLTFIAEELKNNLRKKYNIVDKE